MIFKIRDTMTIDFKGYNKLSSVIIIALLARIIAAYYYADTEIESEWGYMLNNLYEHGVLSHQQQSFNGIIIPSTLMPPLYAYLLFIIKLVTPASIELAKAVLTLQIILSTFSIYIFYKLNNFFFSRNWSIINSFLLSIFPLHIYGSIQISSITLQFFLLISYFYFFFSLYKSKKLYWFNILSFSLVSGLLILTRGEFYLIFVASLICLFFFNKLNTKKIIFIFLMTLLIVSPYLIRNHFTFNKITLIKSMGYNLWKGNNLRATVEGYDFVGDEDYEFRDNKTIIKIRNLPKNNLYWFHVDEFFFKEALNEIKDKPDIFVGRFIKKFLSFFYFNIDANWPNYYHPLFIIPIALVSIFSSIGILISLKNFNFEKGYLLIYLFLTISIFSCFFILPRYKLSIIPIQLIFMNYFLCECYKKFGLLNTSFKDKK